MNRNEYCDRVLAQVGRLTADEANDLRNELAGHIEDHAEALVEHGYTEEDAAARAVRALRFACFSRSASSATASADAFSLVVSRRRLDALEARR